MTSAAPTGTPAESNVAGATHPRIEPDGRVSFRVVAPTATTVQVQPAGPSFGTDPIDLERSADGDWTGTIGPVAPGLHYYWLLVDGVEVNDPWSQTYGGYGRQVSGLEVPDPGSVGALVSLQDVPHGDVRSRPYFAATTGTWRRLVVYTPPGYDTDVDRRYPVLYLQHGSGEDETGWTRQGRADVILDNLIAAGRAEPMLVAMVSGYAHAPEPGTPWSPARARIAVEGFTELQLADVVPAVDRYFRTVPDRMSRAIAGLSMGGRQAVQTGLGALDTFAWIGGLSPAVFRGPGGGFNVPDDYVDATIGDSAVLPEHMFLSAGTDEPIFVDAVAALVPQLERRGIPTTTYLSPGTAHEWQTWRRSLIEMAPLLFC